MLEASILYVDSGGLLKSVEKIETCLKLEKILGNLHEDMCMFILLTAV
jgi:hypothetical protein